MRNPTTRRNVTAALLFAVTLTSGPVLAATVILPNGNRIEGSAIRANRRGDVILTTSAGQQTFPQGSYAKAIADKPAEFDRARGLAAQGQFDQAIALLQKIAEDYRYLEWDNNALLAIASIYTRQEKHAEAVNTYETLMRQSPDLQKDDKFMATYQEALLAAGEYDRLLPSLNTAIASGSRAAAAKAQVMRGDIKLARGQVEAAVMDYLRTAILFESETAVQPEALFKAGKALELMRDPRAKDMYQKLVQRYGQSEYAKEARSKL